MAIERHVIRATFLLTVVLSLGVGETAGLLCQAFCDRATLAAGDEACVHDRFAVQTSIISNTDCASVDLALADLNRGELSKVTAAAHIGAITVTFATELPPGYRDAGVADSVGLLVGNQPRTPVLRI